MAPSNVLSLTPSTGNQVNPSKTTQVKRHWSSSIAFIGAFALLVTIITLSSGPVLGATSSSDTFAPGQRPVAQSQEEMDDFTALTQAVSTPDKFLPMADTFLKKYPESRLRGLVYRDEVAAYAKLKQPDKAFEVGEIALKERENISVMAQLADVASTLAVSGNKTFCERGIAQATQAVTLLEAGKRPYEYTEDQWQSMRPRRMAQIYTALGIMQWATESYEPAVNTLIKAQQLDSREPYTQLILAKSQFGLLQTLTKKVNSEKNSAALKDLETKIQTTREQMLLSYARALVLSEDASYAWLHPSVQSEVDYIYKVLPPEVSASQSLNAQALTNRVRTEQNAEPAKE